MAVYLSNILMKDRSTKLSKIVGVFHDYEHAKQVTIEHIRDMAGEAFGMPIKSADLSVFEQACGCEITYQRGNFALLAHVRIEEVQ